MKVLILLFAALLYSTTAQHHPQQPSGGHKQPQPPSGGKQRQDSRDDAARKMIHPSQYDTLFQNPADLKNKPAKFLSNISASVIARLPKDTQKYIPASQIRQNVPRFAQSLGPQNFKRLIDGVSNKTFDDTFDDWKNQAKDLSKHQARPIIARFGQGKSSFSRDDIKNMGELKKGLSRDQIEKIDSNAISELQGARSDFDSCQRRAVVGVKTKSKSPDRFSSSDVDQLGDFVPDMSNAQMKMMPDSAVRGSFQKISSQGGFRPDQGKTLVRKAQPDASKLTADDVKTSGQLNQFRSSDRVRKMKPDVADEVAKQVKQPRKPVDQTLSGQFFGRRAGKMNGTVHTKNLTCDVMSQAQGQISGLSTREQRGIPVNEFAKCTKKLGQYLGKNNPHQFRAMGDKIFKNKKNSTFHGSDGRNKTISDMKSDDFQSLGHMIKGMRSEHLEQANPGEFAQAVKMGAQMFTAGAQGSQKRAMLKQCRKGGSKKMSDFGSDLAQEIPLGMHQKIPGNFTVMDKEDREVKLRPSQTADSYQRVRHHLGDPAMGNFTKWTAEMIKGLGRVMCGASSEDAENMPADQGETTMDAMSHCSGKHGAQRAIVRAHAANQGFNFSTISSSDIAGFGKLAVDLDVDDIKKMPQMSQSQLCCQSSSNPELKDNVGDDKTKFLLDLCRTDFKKRKSGGMMKRDSHTGCDGSDQVEELDDLNRGRSVDDIDHLCSEAIQNSGNFLNGKFNSTQKRALMRNRLEKVHGNDASKMTGDDLTDSGDSVRHMPDDQLDKLKPEAVGDSLDSMSQVQWSDKQAKMLIPKLEKVWGKNISMWNGRDHRRAGNMSAHLDGNQIRQMNRDTFDDALETVAGDCRSMNDDRKQAIRDGAKMHLGNGSFDKVSEEDIGRMGCAGMHSDVINSKNFGSSEDGIHMAGEAAEKANVDMKTEQQAFMKIKKQRSGQSAGGRQRREHHGGSDGDVSKWTSEQVANMGHLMRGATKDDVDHMSESALAGASHVLGKIKWANVSKEVVDAISQKVRRGMSSDGKSDFPAHQWKCSHTAEMGSLIRKEDVPRLNRSQIQCIGRKAIQNLGSRGSDVMKAFSADQLKTFDSDQAREIQKTDAFSTFTSDQQEAVNAAASVDALTAEETTTTVAPPTPTDGAGTAVASFGGLLIVAVAFIF